MRGKGRRRLMLALVVLLIAATALVSFGLTNLNPIVVSMAEARARQLAVEAINNAIDEVIGSALSYSDLVRVSTDAQGKVSLIQANTLLMNDLASQAALAAQRNLEALADQGVELPLGAALGVALLGGSGPRIRVSVVPVGSVVTRFVTAFESAGINQTRHEISLEASTQMRIVIPTGASGVTVSAYVPVAESIIVGQVPESYVQVPDTDSMLNMVP